MPDVILPDIRKIVVIHAPIEKVWHAVATSHGIAGWWMENTFEPVLGHEFMLHAGPYGDSRCKVTEFQPMSELGFDWDSDWHLTFRLRDLGDNNTEFVLIHSGFAGEKSTSFGQPHTVVHKIMNDGWEKIIKEKLPSYIQA